MTWNADPLEVQAGALADGKSRMLLKTISCDPAQIPALAPRGGVLRGSAAFGVAA